MNLTLQVPGDCAGERLDKALSMLCQEYSRARLQLWIRQGLVQVNKTQVTQTRHQVKAEDTIVLQVPGQATEQSPEGEDIELDIVYEDDDLIVINKAPGMVVHPGAGHRSGTMVNALLHYLPELQSVPRAGLVHRLDKDTSGLMLVARNLESHTKLVRQMQQRQIKRHYQAIVKGKVPRGGTITAALGRDPRHRTRIAVRANGKPATTHYSIERKFNRHTMLKVRLETGRTHQIRVHLAWLKYPVLGDPVYGHYRHIASNDPLWPVLRAWRRQALHAWQLQLHHPVNHTELQWQREAPADMQELLMALHRHDT